MVNRNIYDEEINKIIEINSHHLGGNFNSFSEQIIKLRDNFDIKLMFVGHFSAGKSSLLNRLIGRDNFLKEAQEPTTTMATELIYDKNESAFAYDLNGEKEVLVLDKSYHPNQYHHLEYRLNLPILEKLSDFTIVDTPGFDAGIEAHTRALANYIGLGSAYLVVIDQEKGGLDQSTLDFIEEISNYSNQVAILVNKCDKITVDVAESIAESVRNTLEAHGFPYKVYTISKRDIDVSDRLVSIISTFNAQATFNEILLKQIRVELLNSEKVLSVTKNKIYLDTFDLESDIISYNRLKENLSKDFEQKKEEAKEKLDNTVQTAISQIKNRLISRSDYIGEAYLSGNKAGTEAIIIETISPIMLTIMKDISYREIDNITSTLDFTGLVSETEEVDLTSVAVNLATNLKDLIAQGTFDTKTVKEFEDENKKKNIYHAVTGIAAIATDVIAPWLEVVIILLPDIVTFLKGVFAESKIDEAKRKFINYVVPQIINKIYPQIKQNIEMTINHILNEYQKMLNEKIEMIKNNIIEAQNKKQSKEEEFEQYKITISNDIANIKKLINKLGEENGN